MRYIVSSMFRILNIHCTGYPLGIVYVSFSMQFPTVEECDFDRQFLFDEYVAISHRYDLRYHRHRKAK